jgi:DNA-binding PadR family transcriptional regulator
MNDLILLAALLNGPKHGYALKKWTNIITGKGEMHNNLVYPLLKRFVSESLVSQRQTAGQRGQTREVYALTSKGKQALLDRLGEFTQKDAASAEAFSLRTGMFGVLDKEKRRDIVEARDKWLAHRADRLATIAKSMPLDEWAKETVQHLRTQAEAERNWLERLRKLEKKSGNSSKPGSGGQK